VILCLSEKIIRKVFPPSLSFCHYFTATSAFTSCDQALAVAPCQNYQYYLSPTKANPHSCLCFPMYTAKNFFFFFFYIVSSHWKFSVDDSVWPLKPCQNWLFPRHFLPHITHTSLLSNQLWIQVGTVTATLTRYTLFFK